MHKEARAQIVPIFDTTQMGYLSQLWVLGHCYYFQGLFKINRGMLGYRIALSTYENNYLLGNIYLYSIAPCVHKHAHMQDICSDTCQVLRSH